MGKGSKMALTAIHVQNLLDSITTSILALETAFNTTLASSASSIVTGQSSTLGKLSNISDIPSEVTVGPQLEADTNAVIAMVSVPNDTIYSLFARTLNHLDMDVNGLASYLTTNLILVHPEFANAFNYMVGLRLRVPITTIGPGSVFTPTQVNLGSIAVTGAAAGTFTAGTALNTSLYAPQQLYLQNTGTATTGGTATSFTVTYTNAAGTTGQTVTQALSGTLAAGAYLALGTAVGSAVSGITVNSGGVSGDALAVCIQVLRVPTY